MVGTAILEIGAETGSLFVHDDETGELYTQKSGDLGARQIRVMDDPGIAGAVYQSGTGEIVSDAYADPRFTPGGRPGDRLHHAVDPLRPGQECEGRDDRDRRDPQQAERGVRRARPGAARGDDVPVRDHAPVAPADRADDAVAAARDRVPQSRVGADVGARARPAARQGDVGGDSHARRRALDAVSQRRQDRRAVQLCRRQARDRDQVPEPRGHRRGRVHERRVDPDPLCLRRSPVQPGVRPADRLFHPLDPLRARLQQGRHGHRRHAGAEQARRAVHCRRREPPAGVHGPDRGRPREREAVRRRAGDAELQRVDAREHVERRDHVRRGGRGADLQRRGEPDAPRARSPTWSGMSSAELLRRRERLAARAHGARGGDRSGTDSVVDAELLVGDEPVSANVTVLPLLDGDGAHLGRW